MVVVSAEADQGEIGPKAATTGRGLKLLRDQWSRLWARKEDARLCANLDSRHSRAIAWGQFLVGAVSLVRVSNQVAARRFRFQKEIFQTGLSVRATICRKGNWQNGLHQTEFG